MLQRTASKSGCRFLLTILATWLLSCGTGDAPSATPEQQEQAAALGGQTNAKAADASETFDQSSTASSDAGSDASSTPVPETPGAKAVLAKLRARFTVKVPPDPRDEDPEKGPPNPVDGGGGAQATVPVLGGGVANRFDTGPGGVVPAFAAEMGQRPARVTLSKTATAPFRVEDVATGMAVEVTLRDGQGVPAEAAEGYLVYANGHASGATLLHRALPDGTEDYWSFDKRPAAPTVAYDVALRQGVRGLRLVANTLEMLDAEGTPRLRVSPPTLMGVNGAIVEAAVSLDNCAYDQDPAPPWGRPVVAPGAESCTVRVIWPEDGLVYPALLDPKWSTTGSMSKKRTDHTATLLSNGKVLVAGGNDGTYVFSSAELYDRTTGAWAATGSMTGARMLHTATQLGTSSNATTSGKVLIAGGYNGSSTLNTAQLYSPSAGTWTAAANLNAARKEHTATLLANGKVLVAGGASGTTTLNTAAVYNPASGTGSWAAVGNMSTARKFHTATLLVTTNSTLNNKVLVVGGRSATASLTSVQLFDGTSSWSTLTSLSSARELQTATVVSNGKVLIAGGKSGSSTLSSTLLFNPASGSGSWASAGNMTSARHGHSATLLSTTVLNNGQVLVAGGWNGAVVLSSAELWNGTSSWALTTPLPAAVKYQTDTLLSNGVVLIAGGVNAAVDPTSSAYLYDPSRGSPCTTPTQCASGFCANGVCCDTACTDECGACNLTGLAGTCSPKANGTTCSDDGNPCSADKCNGSSRTCQHPAGNPGVVCRPAAHGCDQAESCNGTSTTCPVDLPAPDGTTCNDGNLCSTADRCVGGVCGGTPVPDGTSCSDGAFCNGAETCTGGLCSPGTPPQEDHNLCTTDTCDPVTNTVGHTDLPAGTNCADGVICQVGTCNGAGVCVGCPQPHCTNGVQDGNETGVDCGGSCPACPSGGGCASDTDCATGLVCGENNGACFGRVPRGTRVCWDPRCTGDGNRLDCGNATSTCGSNCDCVNPCDPTDAGPRCPPGEECKPSLGQIFNASVPDVCVDPRCPSNDPNLCGRPNSLCGQSCICTPNCTSATCANPGDGCGGLCPGVCGPGSTGCTDDVSCPVGHVCLPTADGTKTCRPGDCAFRVLAPPLCGTPGAVCGDQCPVCTQQCDGRQCGPDPNCGQSCGTCDGPGMFCNGAGQCQAPTVGRPIIVPDGSGGSRPVVVVPPPPPSHVGTLEGAFSVSEQGTSEYTIPIDVPPGRAGVQPALALKYGGSRDNGDVGVGWHLEGLSKITRCPKTQSLDRYAGPVRNAPGDHFCIDGKRLEPVAGVNGGAVGIEGANGTEYRTVIDNFARIVSYHDSSSNGAQLDTWVDILPVGRLLQGPDSFRVWTKDGRILSYGATRDAIVMAHTGIRHSWLLTRIEDRAGNFMTIEYTNVGANFPILLSRGVPNIIRPRAISYTGHGTDEGNRQVQFTYEERSDPQNRFLQGGVPLIADVRLSRITTVLNGVPVKNYHLVYASGQVSKVEKIFECTGGGDTHCKAPTQFDYVQESGFAYGASPGIDENAAKLDADGDGIPDYLTAKAIVHAADPDPWLAAAEIVASVAVGVATSFMTAGAAIAVNVMYAATSPGFFGALAKSPHVEIQRKLYRGTGNRADPTDFFGNVDGIPCSGKDGLWVLDYDRDGKDDVVVACPVYAGGFGSDKELELTVVRSNGNGDFENATAVARVPGWENLHPFPLPSPIFVDVDGDSLQDLLYCKDASRLALRRRLGPTQGFSATTVEVDTFWCSEGLLPTFNVFDVDGDGTHDFLLRSTEGWQVLRYSASGTQGLLQLESTNLPDVGGSATGQGMTLGDFNGDGLMDVYNSNMPSSGSLSAVVWLNAADGRFASRSTNHRLPANEPANNPDVSDKYSYQKAAPLDYNADGRTDLVEIWAKAAQGPKHFFNVALIPNSTFTNQLAPIYPVLLWPQGGLVDPNTLVPGGFRFAGDIDGDGDVDLYGFKDAFYGSGRRNLLLKRVVDGAGRLTTISYDETSTVPPDQKTYRADAACFGSQWPETCLKQLRGLVRSHEQGYVDADGHDAIEQSFEYRYFNARMSVTGEGWLGFDRRTVRTLVGALPVQEVTMEYEPVVRYTPTGQRVTGTIAPPYLYPLAGLLRTVTVDDYPLDTGITSGSGHIETGAYIRRSKTETLWDVRMSAFNRPFPFNYRQSKLTFDRGSNPPPPPTNDGILLSECYETRQSDAYGNIVNNFEQCQSDGEVYLEETRTVTEIVPNPASWLVQNPKSITKTSNREGSTATQRWSFTYYPTGLPEVVIRAPDSFAEHLTIFTRDAFGNVTETREQVLSGEDPRTTTTEYDPDHIFPDKITNAKGQPTEVRFDARWGLPAQTADANGIPAVRVYDDFGRLVRREGPKGTSVTIYSDPLNAPVGRVQHLQVSEESQGTAGSRSGSKVLEYDHRGLLVKSRTEGLGGTAVLEEQTYDNLGRLTTRTLPHTQGAAPVPVDRYSYDRLHRVRRIDHCADNTPGCPNGTFSESQYASGATLEPQYNGWLNGMPCSDSTAKWCAVDIVRSVDEEQRQSVVITEHRGLVTRSIDGNHIENTDQSSNYTYGAFNQLRSAKDNLANITRFTVDAYGRRTEFIDPDTGSSSSAYNGYDELVSATDPGAQTRVYHFDLLGRMDQVEESGGVGATRWIYDQGVNAIGRLSESISPPTAENASGNHVAYTYEPTTSLNPRGFLRQTDTTLDGTVYATTYGYDDAGRIDTIHYPNLGNQSRVAAKYHYDTSGVLTGVDEISGPTPRTIWHLDEAFQGHLLQRETFGNGASTQYLYNPKRRWLENVQTTIGIGVVQSLDYSRFNNGLVQFRTTGTGRREYKYDPINRLESTIDTLSGGSNQTTSYTYDSIGNIKTRGNTTLTYQDFQPHLLLDVGGNAYAYDANGNVAFRGGPDIPGGSQSFEYTPFDLPRTIYTGSGPDAKLTQFEYTADETRAIRRDADITRYFVGDFYQRVATTGTSDTVEERFCLYVLGRKLGEIVRKNGTDGTLYFHTDHQGSVDTVTDAGQGFYLQEFDSYGTPINPPSPEVTRAGFTGHQHDNDLGLIDMTGRIYDPFAGRFTSADPTMQAPFSTQGLNRYSYVLNDPVNRIDPNGYYDQEAAKGIFFASAVTMLFVAPYAFAYAAQLSNVAPAIGLAGRGADAILKGLNSEPPGGDLGYKNYIEQARIPETGELTPTAAVRAIKFNHALGHTKRDFPMKCDVVKCMDSAPAALVRSALEWLGKRAPKKDSPNNRAIANRSPNEIGQLEVIDRAGKPAVRPGIKGTPEKLSYQPEGRDHFVQSNHGHPTTGDIYPSNQDATFIYSEKTYTFATGTYGSSKGTLNIMWVNEQGIPQQFFVPQNLLPPPIP